MSFQFPSASHDNQLILEKEKDVFRFVLTFKDNINIINDQNQIEYPGFCYSPIMSELIRKKFLIKSVILFDEHEDLWTRKWSQNLGEGKTSSDEKNVLIFIVKEKQDVTKLFDTLKKHSKNNDVYVISAEKIISSGINYIHDFSIIKGNENTVLAKFDNYEKSNSEMNKKIIFEKIQDNRNLYNITFENMVQKALLFPKNIDEITDNEFSEFQDNVLRREDMTGYVPILEYRRVIDYHPFFDKTYQNILNEIKNIILNKNDDTPITILEIGAMTGNLTQKYIKLLNSLYTSEDINIRNKMAQYDISIDLIETNNECREYLKQIKKSNKNTNIKINILDNDIFTEKLIRNHYTIILSFIANHHIKRDNIKKYFDKIYTVISPNGKFIYAEEYLPEYRIRDQYNVKLHHELMIAIQTYHNNIIYEIMKKIKENVDNEDEQNRYTGIAELERKALHNNLNEHGEYKISLSQAKEDLLNSKLIGEFERIGPSEEGWGGVYYCVIKKTSKVQTFSK